MKNNKNLLSELGFFSTAYADEYIDFFGKGLLGWDKQAMVAAAFNYNFNLIIFEIELNKNDIPHSVSEIINFKKSRFGWILPDRAINPTDILDNHWDIILVR